MLWKLIKNQMDKQHVSAYRLAKMTGLSHNTLQNYKNGHEPSFSNVVRIADALGVSLDEFREKKNGQCVICVPVVCNCINHSNNNEICWWLGTAASCVSDYLGVHCRTNAGRMVTMKKLDEIVKNRLITKVVEMAEDGVMFNFKYKSREYEVIASNGGGWDHVSIYPLHQKHTPSWDVMCILKNMCFNDDEVVMELHPAKKDYVNLAEYCLHLWKPQYEAIPTPPKLFV